jgi:hypothetical protein
VQAKFSRFQAVTKAKVTEFFLPSKKYELASQAPPNVIARHNHPKTLVAKVTRVA